MRRTIRSWNIAAVVVCAALTGNAVAGPGSDTKMEAIEGSLVRSDVVVQTLELPDGRTLEMVQLFPYANKEFACLGNLKDGPDGSAELAEMDCFPVKTSMTPTMY